ncbi:LCP family protein [Mycolicibacterium sp.]|uniref:LCP family protein n=1 Tax=Mycolicibacterium sp. TaxID=2320850 RepID=UPI003D102901
MTDKRPPRPGPVPPRGGDQGRREPPPQLRRDPNYRPPWPPRPPTPPRPQPPRTPPPQAPRPQPPPRKTPPPAARRTPPPPPSSPAAARAKPRRKRRWSRVLLVCLLLAIAAVVGVGVWIETSLTRIPALADYADRPAQGAGTTWLLVGSDSREGLTPEQQAALATGGDLGNSRTDTILLVHVPGLGSSTPPTMVSIPRDSYVPIPDHGSDKINAAYSLGGAPLLVRTVEQATGLRIDHYAEIGFGGFADLVDAVGGVTVCPAEPISDPLAGVELPAGCQELDGRSALGFVRSRATARADLDRMVNQRQFMSALIHRAASPTVLLNPLRWYPMARAATDTVTVDDGDHVWDLARLGWALRGDPVTVTVPIGQFGENGAGSIVEWDSDAAGRLFAALASDSPIPADVVEAGNR